MSRTRQVNVSNVVFLVEATDTEEARDKAEAHLSEVAHDWGPVTVIVDIDSRGAVIP